MRQTSRAVALLLAVESAQAALTAQFPAISTNHFYYTTAFYPESSDANGATVSMQLNSRTAGYNVNTQQQVFSKTVPSDLTSMQLATNPYQQAIAAGAAYSDGTAKPGSSCMQCIGGGGVWCSRTYAYSESAPGDTPVQSAYMYTLEAASKGIMSDRIADNLAKTAPDLQGGASLDQGSCCWSQDLFNKFIGVQGGSPVQADNAVTSAIAAIVFVEASCVALKAEADVTSNQWGKQKIDNGITPFTSWWCSNGLYKQLQKTASDATVVASTNAQQILGNGINKRQELAMIGCPQKTSFCGTGTNLVNNIVTSLVTDPVTLTVLATAMTTADKCTWVGKAMTSAPTFKFGGDIKSSNWLIHAMEYTATVQNVAFVTTVGSLATGSTDAATGLGYRNAATHNTALTSGTFIPQFDMPADQFATLRTWYGEASVAGALDTLANLPAAWLTPGQAPVANTSTASTLLATVPSETYGNVVNVPFSKVSTSTSNSVPVGATNYGLYDSAKFDLRQARYFPAQVAITVHAAGTDQAGKYTTAKNSYTTAKTAWDNYVAILEKNAKTDAFAALFSPPKSPTVPPLPSLPWVPATYSGYVKATELELSKYRLTSSELKYTDSTAANPTAQQFWTNLTAAQTVGGWGSFTAQVLRFRAGWGKSFGTIGYSGAAKNEMSAVWNYKWTCKATATGPSDTTPCDKTYAGTLATPTSSDGAENTTTNLVSVVSLWSTADSTSSNSGTTYTTYAAFNFAAPTSSTFTLTWTPGTWSTTLVALQAIAAPVAADAAKGLSGVAGAQALAATSAAALAVAAALY